MTFESTSNLHSASSLLICCTGSKFTSTKIKLIYSLTISLLVLSVNLNSTESFSQQGRNFHSLKENQITKSELQKTTGPNGEVEQEWVAIYSGLGGSRSDEASDIAVDSFGNVYVTGYSERLGYDFDYATIKYNAEGEVQWISRYEGDYYDWPYKLVLDDSGNVYITGYSESLNTDDDYLTIKYNTDGVEQWVRKYNGPGNGSDRAADITIDNLGNIYVTGASTGSGTARDFATIKYSTYGVEQWIKRYNGPNNSYDEAVALTIDNSGNVLVTGKSIGINNRYNYATIKYNNDGIEQWVKRYASVSNFSEVPYGIAVNSSGDVYVAGSGASMDTTTSTSDYLIIKYDSFGNLQWIARYNGTGNSSDLAIKIATDILGNAYVTGYSLGEGGRGDIATIKFNTTGNEQWVTRFNGGFVYDLAVDRTGNVYTAGTYADSTTIGDFITIKYNTYGVTQWTVGYNGPGDGLDGAVAITLDQFDNIYVTGFVEVQGGIPSFDFATVKYKQRIVPVNLTFFTASITDNSVVLNWQTATETNNSGFEIERQVGSGQSAVSNWETISFVPGFGTTTEPKSYSYTDENVTRGIYRYKLKQIDFNGTYNYSNEIEVEVDFTPKEFALYQNYPNPFNPVTIIKYDLPNTSEVSLIIFDILGRKVKELVNTKQQAGRYEVQFDASQLASGLYIYQLISEKYISSKKMILLK